MSGDGSAMTGEPKTAEEALALHKELLEQENAILSENAELWEKVFMEADKGMAMIEDGKNYGDFLLDTVEAAKEQFTDKEYEWLKESATEISNIENKLTELEDATFFHRRGNSRTGKPCRHTKKLPLWGELARRKA